MTAQNPVPPVDVELAAALPDLAAMPRLTAQTLPSFRAEVGCPDLKAGGAVLVERRWAHGIPREHAVELVVLRPASGTGPWPLLFLVHGGGMVMGTAQDELPAYLDYVAEGLAVVISVEYRLAPEHPDPAPADDCYAALRWAAVHAAELDIDADRIIAVGASAGGGLVAGLALRARDNGFPALTHQILICPMLDDRNATVSNRMLDNDGFWDRNDNDFAWDALLGDRRGGPDVSLYAAPARAKDLSGLPRSYIDVGSSEIFRDEAIAYAQRLSESGVVVDFHMWGGAFHISDVALPDAFISQSARGVRDRFIRRALAQGVE